MVFLAGYEVGFYMSKKINWGRLAQDTVINGVKYKSDTVVIFHENGKVSTGVLAQDTKIEGTIYKAGTSVSFDASGNLKK